MTIVEPADLQGAMWAADEAAGCNGLAALVFQIKGNPARFDITATRRLMLRARGSGVLAMVLRQSGEEEASAAATRWRVWSSRRVNAVASVRVASIRPFRSIAAS